MHRITTRFDGANYILRLFNTIKITVNLKNIPKLLVRRIFRETLKYFFLIVDFFLVLLSHEMILLIFIIYLKTQKQRLLENENRKLLCGAETGNQFD